MSGKDRMLKFRKIITAAGDICTETFWPTRCAICDFPGSVLCDDCAQKLPAIDLASACSRCGAPNGSIVCTECYPPGSHDSNDHVLEAPFPFSAARAAVSYEEGAKRLLRAFKDEDEQRLSGHIATYIAQAAKGHTAATEAPVADWSQWADCIVAVPANPASVRKRGYDHLAAVAREVSAQLHLPLVDALVSARAADQRKLNSEQRAANRTGSISTRPGCYIPPRVLLIDDVFTTGATASAATNALIGGGAFEVRVVVYARVW